MEYKWNSKNFKQYIIVILLSLNFSLNNDSWFFNNIFWVIMNTLIYWEGVLVTFCFMNASLPKMKDRLNYNLYIRLSTIFFCRPKRNKLIDESSDG
jgi:hypothetical protein